MKIRTGQLILSMKGGFHLKDYYGNPQRAPWTRITFITLKQAITAVRTHQERQINWHLPRLSIHYEISLSSRWAGCSSFGTFCTCHVEDERRVIFRNLGRKFGTFCKRNFCTLSAFPFHFLKITPCPLSCWPVGLLLPIIHVQLVSSSSTRKKRCILLKVLKIINLHGFTLWRGKLNEKKISVQIDVIFAPFKMTSALSAAKVPILYNLVNPKK